MIIVFVWPLLIKTVGAEDVDHTNEVSVIEQKVLSYSSVENDYYKFYANGKFVGVISDVDYVNNKVDEKGSQYISEFTDNIFYDSVWWFDINKEGTQLFAVSSDM